MSQGTISIVIPVLNEATAIAATLARALRGSQVEIIVVDGGSTDGTLDRAASLGVKAIASPQPGRAAQMNAGAAIARGDILLFLHADTALPEGYDAIVRETLMQTGAIAGAFELGIDSDRRAFRWVEMAVRWRSRCLSLPYGDQAIFLPRSLFENLGGFADLPIMEDFEFVRRLRQHGRIAIAPVPVLTSGRRWLKLGILRTTLLNQIAIAGYLCGVPPTTLARWYRSGKLW